MINTSLSSPLSSLLRQETVQTMVHDMRAPMTVLKGYLQLLLSGVVGDMKADQRKLVEKSVGPLEELILLTDNLLQAASLEEHSISLTRIDTDLDLLLSDVISFYEMPFSQRKMQLVRGIDARGINLFIDPFWTKRVLHNLIWNAYKFTPDGGKVMLKIQPHDDMIDIVIEDSGRGIPAAKLSTIFDKFSQCSKRDQKFGAGLGLWICRQVMELHGGTVHVESTLGRGTRFILSFPA